MMTQRAIVSLLKPLIASGFYKDEKTALKDIIADYIEKKIEAYSDVIKKMERKYGKDFNTVTQKIRSKAEMEIEDDWMEWKAAILMKESWQKTLRKLLSNA